MQKVSENETIEDIVKEMLNLGLLDEKSTDKIPRSLQALGLRTYAARIKAAHQREVEEMKREIAELRECLEQAYGDKIGTYTMKGNEVERWCKALKGASND